MRRYLTRVFRLTGRATGVQQANQRTVTSAPVNIEVKSSAAPPGEENWTEPMSTAQLISILDHEYGVNQWRVGEGNEQSWAWKFDPVLTVWNIERDPSSQIDPNNPAKREGWIIDKRGDELEVYPVVRIGMISPDWQEGNPISYAWWLADNLRATKYTNGEEICNLIDHLMSVGPTHDGRRARWDVTNGFPGTRLEPVLTQIPWSWRHPDLTNNFGGLIDPEIDENEGHAAAVAEMRNYFVQQNGQAIVGVHDYWSMLSCMDKDGKPGLASYNNGELLSPGAKPSYKGAFGVIGAMAHPEYPHAYGQQRVVEGLKVYGGLYNYAACVDEGNDRQLAPNDWDVPSSQDWEDMERYICWQANNEMNLGYTIQQINSMLSSWGYRGTEFNLAGRLRARTGKGIEVGHITGTKGEKIVTCTDNNIASFQNIELGDYVLIGDALYPLYHSHSGINHCTPSYLDQTNWVKGDSPGSHLISGSDIPINNKELPGWAIVEERGWDTGSELNNNQIRISVPLIEDYPSKTTGQHRNIIYIITPEKCMSWGLYYQENSEFKEKHPTVGGGTSIGGCGAAISAGGNSSGLSLFPAGVYYKSRASPEPGWWHRFRTLAWGGRLVFGWWVKDELGLSNTGHSIPYPTINANEPHIPTRGTNLGVLGFGPWSSGSERNSAYDGHGVRCIHKEN